MKIKYGKPYKGKAKEANEDVGDEHCAVIETWLGLKFLAADFTYLIHFQGMQEIKLTKHVTPAATRAGHPENTAKAAHGAMIGKSSQ